MIKEKNITTNLDSKQMQTNINKGNARLGYIIYWAIYMNLAVNTWLNMLFDRNFYFHVNIFKFFLLRVAHLEA